MPSLSDIDAELSWLPSPDRLVFARHAFAQEGAMACAEMSGLRPRRFVVLTGVADDLSEAPPPGTKRLRLIRHGEGRHNVFRREEFAAGRKPRAKRDNFHEVDPELLDPLLTAKGEEEARAARPLAEAGLDPELLVVSPLRRAVQTGLLAFERAVGRGVPVLASELPREATYGADPSIYDSHRGREELQGRFPQVDFSRVPAGEGPGLAGDPHWLHLTSPVGCHLEKGENAGSNAQKAWQLLCWLMDRPERDIAVATHSLFLVCLLHGALEEESPAGVRSAPATVQLFRTGELRSILVAERPAPPAPWRRQAKAGAALAALAVAALAVVRLRR